MVANVLQANNSAKQRIPTQTNPRSPAHQIVISTFQTPLGWMGLLGEDDQLSAVYVGHASHESILAAASKEKTVLKEADWSPDLRASLEAYSEGDVVDFSDIELRFPVMTEFRRNIVIATRRIGYGETASYGELAQRIGHARAARAVGTVMSSNRFPILIPCHRVLAAGGKLGGYSCPSGTDFKQRLLDLEASARGAGFSPRNPK